MSRDDHRAAQMLEAADRAMAERRARVPLPLLQRVSIASPCHARWDAMKGDARVRHCADCDKDVYDLSEMTEAEATALLSREGPAACVRLHRRADGTVITSDCPVGVSMKRRRRFVAASAAVAGSVLAAAASWMTARALDRPTCSVAPGPGPAPEVMMGAVAVMPPPSTTITPVVPAVPPTSDASGR